MKNKFVIIILAVLLFVPSFIAINSYMNTATAQPDAKNATQITIADLNGQVFSFDKNKDGNEASELIDFFMEMNSNAIKLAALPDALVGTPFFKITIATNSVSAVYQYYFSQNPTEAYFVDDTGATFQIREEDASKFIVTEYASCLYDFSSVPVMTLSGEYTVKPTEASWNYKNYSGEYVSANTAGMIADGIENFDIEGGLGISFNLPPDNLTLKIYNKEDNSLIFGDTYDNIASLQIDGTLSLSVQAEAKWYEDSNRTYYGTMNYSFDSTVSAPAEFYLGESEIGQGEFVTITGTNIKDVSKIKFTSEPSIDFEPVFFKDGDYVRALVPINVELTNTAYTFTVTYGGVTQHLDLKVTSKNFKTIPYAISAAITDATRTDATLAAAETELKPYAEMQISEKYWDGAFDQPFPQSRIMLGFGHMREISSNKVVYRHIGVDYTAVENEEVKATNNGKVIYAGYLDLTGFTVVVDHGFGLKSWYFHLSKINVNPNDIVNKGDVLGIVGSTGFTAGTWLHFGMSVFNIPVSPYPTWSDGDGGVVFAEIG